MDHAQWTQMLHWIHEATKALYLIGLGVILNALIRD